MKVEDRYQKSYKSGMTPWDIGKPDFNLMEVVGQHPIRACKTIDIGCGSGDNAIWLSQNNFQVVGTDTSDVAIAKANEKTVTAKALCTFLQIDFLKNKIQGAPFGFAFDRGCFHSFGTDEERAHFAKTVADHLEDHGLWLTLVGSSDAHRKGSGPPRRSATDIVLAAEPYFEILVLKSSYFGSNRSDAPKAWRCLMGKR